MPVSWKTRAGLVATGLGLAACGGYTNLDRDLEAYPVTDTGVAATIVMPGDPGVPMQPPNPPRGLAGAPLPRQAAPGSRQAAPGSRQAAPGSQQAAPGSASGSSASRGAAAAPSGGGMVSIGGATQEIERHEKIDREPAWVRVLKLPFIVAAYPFKKIHQAVTGPPDPTVKVSGTPPPAPPTRAERQARRERDLLQSMERELAGQPGPRAGGVASQGAATREGGSVASAPPAGGERPSIAAELAALRRSVAEGRAAPPEVAAETMEERRELPETPYESVDRDADGRADRWIYRRDRQVVGEALDEDGDGRPETRVRFAPGTREPAVTEEDTDGDGRIDTWTEHEAGRVVRRRADTSGDGEVDTWSFYQDGELLRHEQDTDGDGFRDRMSFYEEGRLVREEEDLDGNGRPDRVSHFDASERIARREEDTDGDGTMDIRSFYVEGKLRRRELIE